MPKAYEIREPHEKERAELFNIFYVCFPNSVNIFRQLEQGKRPLNDYLYGYEPRVMIMDGRMMANVSLVRYNIYLNGKIVPVGGIASVVTLPEYQRKGYAQILLQERLRNMQEEGTYLSVLLTELPWAYQSLGYKIVPQDYTVTDLSGQDDNEVDACVSITEDLGRIRSIVPLYDYAAPSLNGAIKREPGYWEDYYFNGPTGFAGAGGPFLLYHKGREILGYARLHDEGSQMLLSEIIVPDWHPDILQKLLRAGMKMAADKGYARLVLGLQENHPLRAQLRLMGIKHVPERPEGIREFCMIQVSAKLPEQEKYLKRLHWCYDDKF